MVTSKALTRDQIITLLDMMNISRTVLDEVDYFDFETFRIGEISIQRTKFEQLYVISFGK